MISFLEAFPLMVSISTRTLKFLFFRVINIYIHIISFLLKFKKNNSGYYSLLIVDITF